VDSPSHIDLFKATYPDIRDLGDGRLLAIGTIRIRGRESQVESDVTTAAIVRFRGSVLVHYKDYGDPRLALETAYLSG
jgi:hypothetical protein